MDDFEHNNVCLYIVEKHPQESHYRVKVKNSLDHLTHLR
jgi:hypothetical protein